MVAAFLLILAVPPLRDFYALEIPPQAALIYGLVIAGIACGLLEVAWMITQRRLEPRQRTPRLALHNPNSLAVTTTRDA